MRAWTLLIGIGVAALLTSTACGTSPHQQRTGVVAFTVMSTPANPKVFVDGQFLGELEGWRDRTIPVPVDAERIELRADGHYPHRRDLALEAGRSYQLEVSLVRRYD